MAITPPSSADDQLGRIAKAFHALTIGAALVGGAYAIVTASLPFVGLDDAVLIFLMACAIGLLWVLSVALILLSGLQHRLMLVAPAIALAVLVLAASGVPKVIRVAISDAALTSTVDAIEAGTTHLPEYADEPIFWAGAIPIFGVWGGDTYLVTGFTGSDTPAGLVRLTLAPHGDDPATRGRSYQQIYGNWYRWWYGGGD